MHTSDSLRRVLEFVGLINIHIEGIQWYPISNHINQLANGKPGGHKSSISMIDSDELHQSYSNSIVCIDATDTLVGLAEAP